MEHNVKMTASEMGILWTGYLNDSMAICVLKYFLQHVDDSDVRSSVEHALGLSNGHISTLTDLFTEESFPIPHGFTNDDVNLSAPRLFSDSFYLRYLDGMAMLGMVTYSAATSFTTRQDIRKFYTACLQETAELHNQCVDILLEKGLYARPPFIPIPDKVEFINKQRFLSGFLGERRPVTSVEISHLFMNAQRNELGKALIMGFSQVAESKKVRQYMERGKDISTKHIKIFSDLLIQDDLPAPMGNDSDVTDSTERTFSDKLLTFHIAALNVASMGNYGNALAASPRRDLALTYTRLMGEVELYAEDGANIAIDQGWLEQPPMAEDRTQLAKRH